MKHERLEPRRESGARRVQFAALPCRPGDDGGLLVLLVTSRDTGRWVLPKGWPMKGRDGAGAAAREAYEEAGVKGKVAAGPVGDYDYDKRLESGETVPVNVAVYRLDVTREMKKWPERDQRTRRWFPAAEAAELVDEPGLRELIASLA